MSTKANRQKCIKIIEEYREANRSWLVSSIPPLYFDFVMAEIQIKDFIRAGQHLQWIKQKINESYPTEECYFQATVFSPISRMLVG